MEEVRQRAGHVLQENACWLGLGNNTSDVGPEIAGVSGASSLAGDGEGLTREAPNDEIHDATPSAPIEGTEIRPDRGTIQPSVVHASAEDCLAERVRFDVGDDAGLRERELDTEVERPDPRAEREAIHAVIGRRDPRAHAGPPRQTGSPALPSSRWERRRGRGMPRNATAGRARLSTIYPKEHRELQKYL